MTRPFVITGPNHARAPVALDERTGLPLPPMRDARAGAFSCCADCAARDLDELLLERLVGIVMVALGVVLATWGNLA